MHRMRMFHCSPHLPGPALHVPYRHCPIPTPARMPHIEILRQSVMMVSENLQRNAACDVLRVAMCWLYLSKRGTSWLDMLSLDHPSSTIFAFDHLLLYMIKHVLLIFENFFFALSLYPSLPLLLNV